MPKGKPIARNIFEWYLSGLWHPGKLGAARRLLPQFAFNPVRSHHGPILFGNPDDFTMALAVSGAYGRLISDNIAGLPSQALFIDIGASYGLFTILASQQLSEGQVLAFEPNPDIHACLVKSLELNHANNVTAVQAAVGPTHGTMNLQYNAAHSGLARLVETTTRPHELVSVNVINPVDSSWFDAAATASEIHVKIDVEGYELEVICAFRQARWYERIRSIAVEIDDAHLRTYGARAEEVYQLLQTDGFSPRIGMGAGKHYDDIFVR